MIRSAQHLAFAWSLVLVFAASLVPVARADDGQVLRDFLGGMLNAAIIANARKSWERVDPNVRYCLATRFNLNPDNLFRQGVTAEDQRVVPYLRACEQAVAEAIRRYQQQQAALQAQAQAAEEARRAQAAAAEAAERARAAAEAQAQQAQAAAEEEARRARLAAEAAEKAARESRRRDLARRYGQTIADAIMAGQVQVGMTREQVLAARGNPQQTRIVPPNDELWIYGNDRVALSGGKVTYVGH